MRALRLIIEEKSSCLTDRGILRGCLMDSGWDQRTVSVMVNLLDGGIVTKIQKGSGTLSQTEVYNLVSQIENRYGTARKFIDEGIQLWLEALGAETESQKTAAAEVGGSCGGSVVWFYDGRGNLTISGKGDIPDYFMDEENRPWNSMKDEITTLHINSGIRKVGKNAFSYCSKLESVSLPEGLKVIDWNAFAWCRRLRSINFPSSLKEIGMTAFRRCRSLRSVTLPHGCYPFASFDDTTSVAYLDAPESPWSKFGDSWGSMFDMMEQAHPQTQKADIAGKPFGPNATWAYDGKGTLTISGTGALPDFTHNHFEHPELIPWYSYAKEIKTICVKEGITRIGNYVFCKLYAATQLSLPNSLRTIGQCAFENCNGLRQIELPAGLQKIEKQAFLCCFSLNRVTLPDGLLSIGEGAFKECRLLFHVNFPDSLQEIEALAFIDSKDLFERWPKLPNCKISGLAFFRYDGEVRKN